MKNCQKISWMSRVANDSAWKRRVLKEEAVLERKNLALARSVLQSTSGPSSRGASEGPRKAINQPVLSDRASRDRRDRSEARNKTPVEVLRPPSLKSFPGLERPPMRSQAEDRSETQSIRSYSSGSSVQSYPSSRHSSRSGESFRTTSTTMSKIQQLERILEEERQKRIVAEGEIEMLKQAILNK